MRPRTVPSEILLYYASSNVASSGDELQVMVSTLLSNLGPFRLFIFQTCSQEIKTQDSRLKLNHLRQTFHSLGFYTVVLTNEVALPETSQQSFMCKIDGVL